MYKRAMAESMISSLEDTGRLTTMPGVSGLSLAEVPVPTLFVGRTMAELDLRKSYRVTVLLVKKQDKGDSQIVGSVPDAQYSFVADDVLLVMGCPADLRILQDLV